MLWDRAGLLYRGGLMCRVGDATLSFDVEELKITFKITFRLKFHAENIVIIFLKIEKESNQIFL